MNSHLPLWKSDTSWVRLLAKDHNNPLIPGCPALCFAMWFCCSSHQELESISWRPESGQKWCFGALEPMPQKALQLSRSPSWNSCCPKRNPRLVSLRMKDQVEERDAQPRRPTNSHMRKATADCPGWAAQLTSWRYSHMSDGRREQVLKTVRLSPAQSASFTIMSKENSCFKPLSARDSFLHSNK